MNPKYRKYIHPNTISHTLKNRQKHKTTDMDDIETHGWVQMGVYGCGWMGRSVVVRVNTKMGIGGAQQVTHGHKHTCMVGEISRKYIHDVDI